jgi:hypothetical protein
MHNVTGYFSVFESIKTMQYSRRHRLPKFGPESDPFFVFSFAVSRAPLPANLTTTTVNQNT